MSPWLGGRLAELIVLDDISTGASNDLERATQIARSMVTRYGFSEKLGPVVYGQDQGEVFLGMDINRSRNYSEEVAAEIDQEIRRIIEEAYSRAREILEAHRDQLEVVAQYLMEHEKIGEFGFKALMEGREVNPEEDQHGIFSKVISDAQKEAAAQLEAAQTESQPETPATEPGSSCGCTGGRNPGRTFRSGSEGRINHGSDKACGPQKRGTTGLSVRRILPGRFDKAW